jgi:hypothetical protein
MMEGYWPSAGDAPDAGEHEKSHSRWYKDVRKIVASRTLASKNPNVRVVGDDVVGALRAEKQKAGGAPLQIDTHGVSGRSLIPRLFTGRVRSTRSTQRANPCSHASGRSCGSRLE